MYVCKADGDWQFLCGEFHNNDEVPRVVGLGHILSRDKSLLEIMDLEDDWEADRENVGGAWTKRKCV